VRRLVLALAFCCMLASDAAAKPLATRLVGHASQMIGSDGARFAAWHEDPAVTDVYDALRRTTTRVPAPAGCVVTGIGAAALVATCDAHPFLSTATVWDLPRGVWRAVVAPDPGGGDFESRTFVGIGRRWIQAERLGYHFSYSAFYARSDGSAYGGPSPFGAHVQPDLGLAGLRRQLCSPLRAIVQERSSESTDGWYPLQLGGRYAIAAPRSPGAVVLRHCGTMRERVVCRRWCFTPALVRGHVLWADDRGAVQVRGVHARRATAFAAGLHAVAGVYPAGPRVVLATDLIAGKPGMVVRSASARAVGIG
jgi:hypothetical protein